MDTETDKVFKKKRTQKELEEQEKNEEAELIKQL
jgi:hypothetical protein